MLLKWHVPKTIQWVIKLFLIFTLVFTLFRVSTYLAFKPNTVSFTEVAPSFIMGLRFDVKWICLLLLPIVLFSFVPKFSPYSSLVAKKIWVGYLAFSPS
jgi:hypothetical protein